MSFSQDVKIELENVIPNARHCQMAELQAIFDMCPKEPSMSTPVGRKFFTLRKKTSMMYGNSCAGIKNSCCKRAYLRGAFLSVGSMSDPSKAYNLEFVCDSEERASLLLGYAGSFGIDARVTKRKESFVLYIREAESLVDILNVLGAHKSLMALENLRVEKDFRNLINRKVNCETANIAKAVDAAARQISDIRRIEESMGLDALPASLRQIAVARIEHPDSSLTELGAFLDPPVGKSGVNHRLRKLSEIADSIKD